MNDKLSYLDDISPEMRRSINQYREMTGQPPYEAYVWAKKTASNTGLHILVSILTALSGIVGVILGVLGVNPLAILGGIFVALLLLAVMAPFFTGEAL